MIRATLELLACPLDGAFPLRLACFEESAAGEVLEGCLTCPDCRRWFPITRAIPALFPDELRGGWEDTELLRRWRAQLPGGVRTPFTERRASGTEIEEKLREIRLRDEESELYDVLYPDELNRTERRNYDALFPVGAEDRLLDAGCGTGRLTKDYLPRCRETVGVDFSGESLRTFQRRLRPDQRPRVHLAQADLCHLPLRDRTFDRLLSSGVLCCVPQEASRREALRQFRRVLVPGGVAAINVYHYSWMKRLKAALGAREANLKEGFHSGGSVHYVNFERREFRDWLSEGFAVRTIRGVYHRVPVLSRLAPRLSDRLDAWLGRLRFLAPVFANELTGVVAAPALEAGSTATASTLEPAPAALGR